MPKVSQAHLDARRQQILDAAAACFYRKGFHLSTMQDICKEADLSPGAVYRYFTGKNDIIKTISEENRSNNIEMIKGMRKGNGHRDILDQLIQTFFKMIDEFDQHPSKLYIEIWAETFRNEQVRTMQSESFKAYETVLSAILRDGQEAGSFQPDFDPKHLARILISFFDGLLVQKAVDPDVDVWAYVDTMRKLINSIFSESEYAGDPL